MNKIGTEMADAFDEIIKPIVKYEGCQSWACKTCKHYIEFLTVSTMQGICWNKGCFYEKSQNPPHFP